MALTQPRIYEWTPDPLRPGAPFVTGEGLGDPRRPYPYHLRAGDGHRIPFPTRILDSDYYWERRRCRVRLFVEDGVRPQYPGVNYVMEIQLSGHKSLTRTAREAMSRITVGVPRTPQLGPVGQLVMAVFRPSPLAAEGHWTDRVSLGAGQTVVVRYDYLPVR